MNSQKITDTENLQQDVPTDYSQEELEQEEQNQKHTSDWTPDIDIAQVGEAVVEFLGGLFDGI